MKCLLTSEGAVVAVMVW